MVRNERCVSSAIENTGKRRKGHRKETKTPGPRGSHFIFFCILFYSILFHPILFYSILCYSILFYSISWILTQRYVYWLQTEKKEKRETSIHCLPCPPRPRTRPATHVCVLTEIEPTTFQCTEQQSKQLSHSAKQRRVTLLNSKNQWQVRHVPIYHKL